jgi:hypothetical protein
VKAASTPLQKLLQDQLIAISVSDSPDLGRLGLLERSLRQTVSALVTRLVRHGARIAYGGNLDRTGYTHQLYPAVAQAYATAALRSARPPFVHYVAAYLAQDTEALVAHAKAIGYFAEMRIVGAKVPMIRVVMQPGEPDGMRGAGELRWSDAARLSALLADMPRRSAQPFADLETMRAAMENQVTARIVIGGKIAGHAGARPGILHEALLALGADHALYPLGGFGGAARDLAVALGLLAPSQALRHAEIGSGYNETLAQVSRFAQRYRAKALRIGCWEDLRAAACAEDPDAATRHLLRAMARHPTDVRL